MSGIFHEISDGGSPISVRHAFVLPVKLANFSDASATARAMTRLARLNELGSGEFYLPAPSFPGQDLITP